MKSIFQLLLECALCVCVCLLNIITKRGGVYGGSDGAKCIYLLKGKRQGLDSKPINTTAQGYCARLPPSLLRAYTRASYWRLIASGTHTDRHFFFISFHISKIVPFIFI